MRLHMATKKTSNAYASVSSSLSDATCVYRNLIRSRMRYGGSVVVEDRVHNLLQGMLEVSWIHPATGEMADDTQFFSALQELMAYAFDEYARLEKEKRSQWRRGTSDRPGILAETNALLRHYRGELLAESGRLLPCATKF